MLYLNSQEIISAVSCGQMMDAVEQAMEVYEDKEYTMPERMNVPCGDGNILLLMPCIAGDYMVTKMLTLYPENRQLKKPVIQATVMLADSRTGTPLAIMDGGTITAMRTGAVGGSSIRHLARTEAQSIGLVGCGVQGLYQLRYGCDARDIKTIALFDKNLENSAALSDKLQSDYPYIKITIAGTIEELVEYSDIVITTTTARTPVFPDRPEIFADKHCIAVGSFEPDVREYPDALFTQISNVCVDIDFAKEESGEILLPLAKGLLRDEQIITLGQFIRSGEKPERGENGTTFFKTVGMALFDLAAARLIYECSKESGIGTVLD
jgi:ornithine cyclodeaminase/alanine dehydrogenase-like protein (mu-crystallin family)